MINQRSWKVFLLGTLGLTCAIAFNACTPNSTNQASALSSQAVVMAQPSMTGAEINERLLSVLPPVNDAGVTEAAAHPWPKDSNIATNLNVDTDLTLAPTSQAAPEPRTPAPEAPAPPVPAMQAKSQTEAIAFSGNSLANTRYGHYPYAEAYRDSLTVAGYYGSRPEQLHLDASQAFQAMVAAAKQEDVALMAISGFRDIAIQRELFAAQTARQGSAELAARISAPPGHSEHHTGFAIDVGDEGYPRTDLEITFEQTPGFRWMAQNAAAYGFELSFPRGNAQGVSYEPWHWRFVGTTAAQRVFAQAR